MINYKEEVLNHFPFAYFTEAKETSNNIYKYMIESGELTNSRILSFGNIEEETWRCAYNWYVKPKKLESSESLDSDPAD